MLRSNPNPAIIDLFKVDRLSDRLQIYFNIRVAKKVYIYVSQLFISRVPKMRAIPQLC